MFPDSLWRIFADHYGRTVGVVEVYGLNVNESLIKESLAWQYRKYCKESFCSDWIQLENQAKASNIGIPRLSSMIRELAFFGRRPAC